MPVQSSFFISVLFDCRQLKAKARRVMKPVAGGRVGTRFDPIMLHFHQHSSQIILNGRKLTASGGVAPLTTAQRIKRVWMSARDSICLTMSSEATRHRQVRQLTTPDKVMVHAIEPKLARVKVIPGPGVGGNPSYPATLFTGSYHRSARINPTPTVFHIDVSSLHKFVYIEASQFERQIDLH